MFTYLSNSYFRFIVVRRFQLKFTWRLSKCYAILHSWIFLIYILNYCFFKITISDMQYFLLLKNILSVFCFLMMMIIFRGTNGSTIEYTFSLEFIWVRLSIADMYWVYFIIYLTELLINVLTLLLKRLFISKGAV